MTDRPLTSMCDLCGEHPIYADTLYCMPCIVEIREWSRCPDCLSSGEISISAHQPGIVSVIKHSDTCPLWAAKRTAGEVHEVRHLGRKQKQP
ncbi:hypothetical protein [Mycobacterium sp.]|uniref:hypothetical protein n=1 Tax=Mycobacterium sp. TaxID=1785 RepID=UPI003F9AB24D